MKPLPVRWFYPLRCDSGASGKCNADFRVLCRFDGDAFHFAADVGAPAELAEFMCVCHWSDDLFALICERCKGSTETKLFSAKRRTLSLKENQHEQSRLHART